MRSLLALSLLIASGCGSAVPLEPSASAYTLRICDEDGVSADRVEASVDKQVSSVCWDESEYWHLRGLQINESGIKFFTFYGGAEGIEFPFGEASFACREAMFNDANYFSRLICGSTRVDCRESLALPCD